MSGGVNIVPGNVNGHWVCGLTLSRRGLTLPRLMVKAPVACSTSGQTTLTRTGMLPEKIIYFIKHWLFFPWLPSSLPRLS